MGKEHFASFQTFTGAIHFLENSYLPNYQEVIPIEGTNVSLVEIIPVQEENLLGNEVQHAELIGNQFKINYQIGFQRGKNCLILNFIPLRNIGGSIKKLTKFSIHVQSNSNSTLVSFKKKPIYAANSLLASGDWYKIATLQNGVYRIDYATLKSIGINPDVIDPRKIRLFGNGAGMLPQNNDADRFDDLNEISILVQGEDDGKFNPGDFISFYGESQINQWNYNPTNQNFNHVSNFYSDTTYYFLTVSNQNGKRIKKIPSALNPNQTINSYNFLYCYENDRANLIKSGKIWVGEEFDKLTQQNFNLSIPNLITTEPIKFTSSVTSHSFVGSQFQVSINGTSLMTQTMGAVQAGFEEAYTPGLYQNSTTFLSNTANFTLNYNYNKPASGSIGWLDFFEIQARAELRNYNSNFIFRDNTNIGSGKVTQFNISSNRSLIVLDITKPTEPFIVEGTLTSNIYSFATPTDSLKSFAAYDGGNYFQIINAGKIANQNLHALGYADGFIISHPKFMTEAKRLAEFHKTKDNLTIHVVNIQDIYNEFSSGSADVCALRDFFRMFYKRAATPDQMPKYATLMGRASYDYKYRQKPNSNYIPTFESYESFSPTGSYCSDDFLGLLDDEEGHWDMAGNPNELMDIGIGRIIVQEESEANTLIDKIISYATKESLANWRNHIVFTADDEDNNLHQTQADNLANKIISGNPEFNVEKIYLDAYKKESTAGGSRFPDAQKAINNAIEKGCLIFNYTGHGGEVGLTAERVLGIDDINGWTNGLASSGGVKLPLFLTATCEFSRFDDPSRFAAGELVLLSPNGGAIALFTTVRLVYSTQNESLNNKFYENIGFDSISQLNPPRLGDVIRKTKNAYLDPNTRNFTLLGDPFLKLAYPNYEVKTTHINDVPVATFTDTLKALKKIEIKGIITNKFGALVSDFNGTIYPTIYDKMTTYSTLGNNPPESTPMPFIMQNNVLYRGKATVENGVFKFSFIVPKDIAYQYGLGKISYYSENQITDANGFNNSLIIGGTSDSIANDPKGPELKLFLNDEKFVNGGLTNQNPVFIAKLYDESGINTTGKGIGRDLVVVLDNNTAQSVVLNDYYEATINSYQSGQVKYSFKNLGVGKHTIKFKAYDVYNNGSESTLDFEVKNIEKPQIDHLLNYPNPFNNFTTFHFDHNQTGENLSVMIQIFTVSGKLIKTLQSDFIASGSHFDQLNWDGRDEYGDKLAKGVYIYKVKLKSSNNKVAEKLEKLVILN